MEGQASRNAENFPCSYDSQQNEEAFISFENNGP